MSLVQTLINENMIRVQAEASNWKEAVRIGIECLVNAQKATWNYYEGILRSVEKNGPYFVLMPGVVLPHARPEEGALATGFSLVTLKTPVNFNSPENDPISILLSFCAKDSASQVEETLVQAVSIFEDESIVTQLIHAPTREEIVKVLKSVKED